MEVPATKTLSLEILENVIKVLKKKPNKQITNFYQLGKLLYLDFWCLAF